MTVPLPEVGDGSRRRRRRERQRGGRRTVTRALAIVVLVALIGAVGWVAVDLARGDGSRAPTATQPTAPMRATRTTMARARVTVRRPPR